VTGGEIAEAAKNAGVVLAALSGATYGCGYLVVRARARALGTDPGFQLIDQAYVFAGVRFVLLLMFALLVTAPLLLLLRAIGRLAGGLAPEWLVGLETVGAIAAGGATIWAYVVSIGVTGILLAPSSRWFGKAALEGNRSAMLLVLATTALGAATLLWADAHLARADGLDPLGAVLLLTGALVLVLLPMQHGIFYADRNARRLERMPEGVAGLEPPIWLVDRGAGERVVLYGHGADGRGRLVTVKAEKLDGIAVTEVTSLGAAVAEGRS
jgi:hypothetical protein